MTVHIVTDSSACLPAELTAQHNITVLDLHTFDEGEDKTTAGLSALELTATYARLLERGGDDGVVAIHLSKELSATWSNAISAAGVFDGLVRIVDTNNIGMVLGYAAVQAAKAANNGADVAEVARVAQRTIAESSLWLYVHRLDNLRKGGRISAGQSLITTALAIKPIFQLTDGKLILAAKTRTQAKAMDKLVDTVHMAVVEEAMRATRVAHGLGGDATAGEQAKSQSGSEGSAAGGAEGDTGAKGESGPEGGDAALDGDKEGGPAQHPVVESLITDYVSETPRPRTVHIAIHHHDALEVASDLMRRVETKVAESRRQGQFQPKRHGKGEPLVWDEFPEVKLDMVELSPVLSVHTGAGAVGAVVAMAEG